MIICWVKQANKKVLCLCIPGGVGLEAGGEGGYGGRWVGGQKGARGGGVGGGGGGDGGGGGGDGGGGGGGHHEE